MDIIAIIGVFVTVILACVAASRGREVRRLKVDLEAAVEKRDHEKQAFREHRKRNDAAYVICEQNRDNLSERLTCLTVDRDRLADESDRLRSSYLRLHNGLCQCLGLLAGHGYKNKSGPLERGKTWRKLKELELI